MRMTPNERGQTAIFVAMIFQVLFVLFAMSINVGLVVHDKINLQNSVDLAAYYAAQKQAEILNAIGHSNYQIRQSWKLLAWRYRVLGTMGKDEHPVRKNITSDTLYTDTERPTTCVTYYPIWKGVAEGENLCRQSSINIPPLPNVPVIAPFLGINAVISALSISLINQYNGQCQRHGAYNWWFAASSMMAFRIDQSHRKRTIFGLAQNLSGGNPEDFLDLDGNSVFAGVAKTLDKNLTFANKTSPGGVQIHLFNSLHNVRREEWLPEIQTIPTIIYTDVDNTSGCRSMATLVETPPQIAEARNYALNVLGGNEILPWVQSEPPTTHIMHMSMGVEKNPWFMAYVGVMAETRPRQIFFPFGPAISLKARAYAKPFGGRIGPWYHASWPRSSAVSVGPRTDPLAPPRTQQNGMLDSPSDITRLPNYSRFPGDQLGLRSGLALNGLKDLLALQTSFDEYKQTFRGMVPGAPNDPLAWDYDFDRVPPVRRYELSAISPDLFDVTYYGIEPNFSANYFSHIFPNFSKFPFPPETLIRPDLGFRGGSINLYSVQDQMSDAAAFDKRRFDSFYFVREKAHLLTSWAPANQALNFEFPENFGKCSLPDDDMTVRVPGSCAAGGGRTGYSVKLVSRDALVSGNHAIGGVSEPAGSILNPPPNQDGW